MTSLHCDRCNTTFDADDLERVSVPCDPPSGVSSHCYVWISPCCGNEADCCDCIEEQPEARKTA